MNKVIVYGSTYGTTRQYAEELSKRTHIKALSFKDSTLQINDYDLIIYLGGLYAGGIADFTDRRRNRILHGFP